MSATNPPPRPELASQIAAARSEKLDEHVRETVRWHFDDATGCPFWLEKKRELNFDPLTEVNNVRRPEKIPPL